MNKRGYFLLAIAGIAALLFAVGFHVTHRNDSETGHAMHGTSAAEGAHASESTTWICPMHPQIRQDHPGRCPICGMDLVVATGEEPSADGHAHGDALSTHHHHDEPAPAANAVDAADAWICPMHPQVRQDHPGRCPICGMDLVLAEGEPSASGHSHDEVSAAHHHHDEAVPVANVVAATDAWVCPMHSQIRQDHPGRCPICGMDLVHHEGGDAHRHEAGIPVDGELQQRLGVRLAAVERRQLSREIRSWGTVVPNESALFEVSPKVDGWLRKLHVSAVGETVRAGQALYELYSPDLVQRQREFIELLRRGDQLREAVGMPTGQNAQMLASLARERLRNRRLFENADLDKEFIDRLEQYRRPVDVVVVRAVRSGVVTRIGAREGSYITPQTSLLSLANLSQGWVDITVYPDQRAWVAAGDAVTVTSQDVPNRQISGKLQLPNPLIDRGSRTLRARMVFDNSDGQLLPGTDVDVRIETASHSALAVPRSALIRTGAGDRVMLADDDSHFAATPVQIGIADDDYVEIVSGLDEGQRVAVSGQFLLDAAASLQVASRSAQDAL